MARDFSMLWTSPWAQYTHPWTRVGENISKGDKLSDVFIAKKVLLLTAQLGWLLFSILQNCCYLYATISSKSRLPNFFFKKSVI